MSESLTDRRPANGSRLAEMLDRLIAAAADPAFGPDPTSTILRAALDQPGDWLDPRYTLRDADRPWMLYPLYRAPDRRCSALVAVFGPGIQAPVHDHGSWAVIGVYRGRERETWFRRADDRPVHGPASLTEVRSFVNDTGSVHLVPDGAVHTVEALDGVDAISLHVYGTDIVTQERSTFDLATGTEEVYRPDFSDPSTARRSG